MAGAAVPSDAAEQRVGWIVAQSARSAYLNPAVPPVPTPWIAAVLGIPKWGAVARKGGEVFSPVPCTRGGADPPNSWAQLAVSWEWTRDGVLLDTMNRLRAPQASCAARLASLGRTELRQTPAAVRRFSEQSLIHEQCDQSRPDPLRMRRTSLNYAIAASSEARRQGTATRL